MTGTLKEIAKGRSDIFYVDPHDLQVKAGWNCRINDDPENRAHIEALAKSIAEVGVLQPLVVFREDDKIYVSDGHCRLAATLKAIHEMNVPIESIPVKTEGRQANEADYVFRQLLDGKPKTAFELGLIYKRLCGFGWTIEQIAAKSGKSTSAINAALDLQGAPVDVQRQVLSGRISATEAVKAVRKHGSEASKVVNDAIDHAAQRGKAKATALDVGVEPKIPRANKLAYVAEIIERADIADAWTENDDKWESGHTRIVITDADWESLQKLLKV